MRIIFVCHEANRTGVPLLLLQLIRWLKANHNIKPFIILLRGGPLERDFNLEGRVFIWNKTLMKSKRNNLVEKVMRKSADLLYIRLRRIYLTNAVNKFGANMVYLNTAAALNFLSRNSSLFKHHKKVLHCHEMPYTIKKYVPDSIQYILTTMDKTIVVNSVIEKYFLDRHVASQNILRVPEYFCKRLPPIIPTSEKSDIFKIVSVGLGSWRKGIDLFVLSAYYFSKLYDGPFSFTWVGLIQPTILSQLQYDIKQYGLDDKIKFAGEVEDTSLYLKQCDVFFLTSREDPYPLVMMEAAWFEKPVLYFNEAGGASEFVNDEELAVDAFDVHQAANRLVYLAQHENLRKKKGQSLKEKVHAHTIENVGKEIFEFINS